ncbi:MAG: hypothetical protein ACYC3V_21550, partial [Chloroflexota bacterium]
VAQIKGRGGATGVANSLTAAQVAGSLTAPEREMVPGWKIAGPAITVPTRPDWIVRGGTS